MFEPILGEILTVSGTEEGRSAAHSGTEATVAESGGVETAEAVTPLGANVTDGDMPTTSDESQRRKRLSGAARKRFKRLLEQNVSAGDARALATMHWADLRKTGKLPPEELRAVKRARSEEESPKTQPKKAAKLVHVDSAKPSFREVAGSSRVGIRDVKPMTEEEMSKVHEALLDKIADAKKGTGPRFLGLSQKPGWILVTCEDEASQNWLTNLVPIIKPWPEAKLSVMAESDLPKPTVATTLVPSSEAKSVEKALTLFGSQNPGLNPEHWRVLHTRNDKGGLVVTFSLDDPSVETLRRKGYKAVIGFKSVSFRVKGSSDTGKTGRVSEQGTGTVQGPGEGSVPPGVIVLEPGPSGVGRPAWTKAQARNAAHQPLRTGNKPSRGGKGKGQVNSGRGRPHQSKAGSKPAKPKR